MRTDQRGFSLMETMIALGILAVVAAGVLPLGAIATRATENQGHLTARTTEYAQDKLEQLMALAYGDSTSDTTQFPAANAGGTGLTVGGSVAGAVNGYVDYLDVNGNVLGGGAAAPANWYYMRLWSITSPRANLKQITVFARVNASSLGGPGLLPQSTVSALKSFPF